MSVAAVRVSLLLFWRDTFLQRNFYSFTNTSNLNIYTKFTYLSNTWSKYCTDLNPFPACIYLFNVNKETPESYVKSDQS